MSTASYIRRFGKLAILILVVTLFVIGIFAIIDRVFRIQEIQVTGASVTVEVDPKKLTKNLLFFPRDLVRSELLSDNPLLSDVVITKKYPHTLIFTLSVRTPVARLQIISRQLLVDGRGVVLGENSAATNLLPVIAIPIEVAQPGATIQDARIISALSFIQEIGSSLPLTQISAFDSTSLLAKIGNTDILFREDASMRETATTLQTIFSGFRIKGTLPTRIDLRFDKPIVTF